VFLLVHQKAMMEYPVIIVLHDVDWGRTFYDHSFCGNVVMKFKDREDLQKRLFPEKIEDSFLNELIEYIPKDDGDAKKTNRKYKKLRKSFLTELSESDDQNINEIINKFLVEIESKEWYCLMRFKVFRGTGVESVLSWINSF